MWDDPDINLPSEYTEGHPAVVLDRRWDYVD